MLVDRNENNTSQTPCSRVQFFAKSLLMSYCQRLHLWQQPGATFAMKRTGSLMSMKGANATSFMDLTNRLTSLYSPPYVVAIASASKLEILELGGGVLELIEAGTNVVS